MFTLQQIYLRFWFLYNNIPRFILKKENWPWESGKRPKQCNHLWNFGKKGNLKRRNKEDVEISYSYVKGLQADLEKHLNQWIEFI